MAQYENQVIYNTPGIPNEKDWEEYEKKRIANEARTKSYKKVNYVSYLEKQCVTYAKQLTGVYGTWGNGGRYLSGNSGPEEGAVIIFNYTHVGVILWSDGYNIAYTDRNIDYNGLIRPLVYTTVNDPTIVRYHKF